MSGLDGEVMLNSSSSDQISDLSSVTILPLSDSVSEEVLLALRKLGGEINNLSENLYSQHQIADEDLFVGTSNENGLF